MLPTGVSRYLVDIGEYRMHVMEVGQGTPVLMLHGNPAWGFLYHRVAAALRGEPLRLIMPDLVGLGFSDKPTNPAVHQLDNHGRWLGHLIDTLGLEDMIFVGQDWGGPIGLYALSHRAPRVSGLVILNTVIGPPKPGFRPALFHRLSRIPLVSDAAFRLAGFPQNLLALAQGKPSSMLGDIGRAYRYPLRRVRDRVAPLALARMVPDSLAHPSVPALERCQAFVESFTGPAAIVWGERDPILGRVSKRVARALPGAKVTMTQAGHFLQEEVPHEIAAAITWVAAQRQQKTPDKTQDKMQKTP